jgi:hypothetical protein
MRASLGRAPKPAARLAAVGIAVLITLVVLGAGYGLQRATLRSPTQGELVAAQIEQTLLWYRYVESEVHVPGEPVRRGQCLESWLPRRKGKPKGRGARIAFSDGERLLLGDRRILRIRDGSAGPLAPIAAVQLAGCGRALTQYIYAHLVDGRRASAVRTTFLGRPADSLHVGARRTRFTLFVDPETHTPVGLRVRADGVTSWSRVRQIRLTPARKQAFLRRFNG